MTIGNSQSINLTVIFFYHYLCIRARCLGFHGNGTDFVKCYASFMLELYTALPYKPVV